MRRSIFYGVLLLALTLAASPALAGTLKFSSPITQDNFNSLSKELGAAVGYKNMAPAEPLGITGFDIGLEVEAIDIKKESAYWKSAYNNDAASFLVFPKLRVRKGLPFGIDIGAMYTYVPDSNIKLYGAEVSYAILEGGIASPAIGVRGTYSKLSGVSDLGLQTAGLDASISKGFLFLTPYVGAGVLWVSSEAKGNLQAISQGIGTLTGGAQLKDEKTAVPRYFGGLKISPLPIFSVTAEAEYAVRPIYSLKVAIGF